ncbi:oxalurate catabolism protein HpxZ [Novosphingobium sp. fls2-241-R2A-195]|uniref:oxalurate catabolism protein HpxZ n=1 Tax=Novosphingobium sp. fls2-241-R2A-195 TaxID=3040296 RepID=UPI00254FBED1|nr:oxalurate catabolism protein HpxZ [Novosphingobium sp. fls2-241-R2A-195]
MRIDDPVLLAEVTHAFHAYETALMADDIPAMDALFHDAPTTNRYGVGEVLYGIEEIRAFRKGRGGSPQRKLGKVAITVYGDTFATADAEFFREGSAPEAAGRRGRQTQSWVRFADGWKVVSAHVSLEGSTS